MDRATKKITGFTDLISWQKAHELTIEVYKSAKLFPREELFALVSQLHRASASIGSNIAEGFGRLTYKDRAHFYVQARGSLVEVKNHLLLARDLGYLPLNKFRELDKMADETHRLLNGLISKTRSYS